MNEVAVRAGSSEVGPILAAQDTLDLYASATGVERDAVHPKRVGALATDLCDDVFDVPAETAAYLQDIGERAQGDNAEAAVALSALKTFSLMVGPNSKLWEEVSDLLTDIPIIDEFVQQGRKKINTNNTEIDKILQGEQNGEVKQHYWQVLLGGLAMRSTVEVNNELLTKVNIQSPLNRALELLDNLRRPSQNDAAVFRDAYDAKSFYATLSEALRHDAVSMSLSSLANILCLQKMGMEDALKDAVEILKPYQDRETVRSTFEEMFKELLGGYGPTDHVITDTAEHNIILGTSSFKRGVQEPSLRAVWRLKSLGSLAAKIFKKGYAPDVFGVTIVCNGRKQLEDVFSSLIINIDASERAHFADLPAGEEPIYIRGNKGYIEKIEKQLKQMKINHPLESKPNDRKKEFRVAKVMIEFDGKPMEIMVQTESDRRRSRIGRWASHVGYKLGPQGAAGLKKIYKRLDDFGAGTIEPSKVRGEQLRALVEAAEPLPQDWRKL
ncbi:MAG: hypothetical protein WAQ24_04400 [Candidatus Saccharimonadales bacterium]